MENLNISKSIVSNPINHRINENTTILEINVPDGIGTHEDALNTYNMKLVLEQMPAPAKSFMLKFIKEVPYNVVSYEDCEIND